MRHRMSKNAKAWLILATLLVVAVAVLSAFWAIAVSPLPRPPPPLGEMLERQRENRPVHRVPGDIEFFYTAKTVISSVNVTLLVCLLIIYANIYRKTKSEFTIGLIIFSVVLLLYALVSNPILHGAFGFGAFGLGPFAMLPDLFTCIALIVLLYLTVKY